VLLPACLPQTVLCPEETEIVLAVGALETGGDGAPRDDIIIPQFLDERIFALEKIPKPKSQGPKDDFSFFTFFSLFFLSQFPKSD
jgi:hypothetical protein